MPRDPARVDINPHFTLAFSRSLNMFTRFCRSEDGVLLSSLREDAATWRLRSSSGDPFTCRRQRGTILPDAGAWW